MHYFSHLFEQEELCRDWESWAKPVLLKGNLGGNISWVLHHPSITLCYSTELCLLFREENSSRQQCEEKLASTVAMLRQQVGQMFVKATVMYSLLI